MIILDATTDSLQAVLAGAVATNNLDYFASYVEITSTTYVPGSNQGDDLSGTTARTLVGAPSGGSTQRLVKFVSINNLDTATVNVIIQEDITGTPSVIFKAQLLTLEKLTYTDGEGWRIYDAYGVIKNNFSWGIAAISAGTTRVAANQAVFSNSNSMSFGMNGQTITGSFNGATTVNSSYANTYLYATQGQAPNFGNTSAAQQFYNPGNLDLGFLRIPVSFVTSTASSTATVSNVNASVRLYTTLNAAIYTQGSGLSSLNLYTVAKGSVAWTQVNSVSVAANGTQFSYSHTMSCYAKGGATNASFTTQGSSSNANSNSLATSWLTNFTGLRYIEIPLDSGVATLVPGDYWLMVGWSTLSESNSTGYTWMTGANARATSWLVNSQPNIAMGVMGASNLTSCVPSVGRISGQQLADILSISAISSTASNGILMFQLMANVV